LTVRGEGWIVAFLLGVLLQLGAVFDALQDVHWVMVSKRKQRRSERRLLLTRAASCLRLCGASIAIVAALGRLLTSKRIGLIVG
jgi:ABC-type transporter Mla maintaining outer membrane lipid asymmetry ATPase subunit MlaF